MKKKERNIKEKYILKLLLFTMFIFLNKTTIFYVGLTMRMILEKYDLVDNDLSDTQMEKLKEELSEYVGTEINIYLPFTSLSSLSLSFSDNSEIMNEGNLITHKDGDGIETCIFDKELKKVCYISII